ncbi:MAG TPA: putative LPS assembly protein LptD [Bacteroidales bacterium]|nr:putative LPS assembly protein LptD [Bacteroidales bacterium]
MLFLMLAGFSRIFPQENRAVRDTVANVPDSTGITFSQASPSDTLIPGNVLESQVVYTAQGYIKRNIVNKNVVLVDNAKVNYGNIEITADSISINMNANTLFAIGRKDTSGTVKGSPVFKEGSQEIQATDLLYNFRTKKARASNIETKQDQGLLRSKITKLLEDGTSNIGGSTYSTCEADPPHFYINLPKARVYPGKKLVSGPGNLVLEGIPLPLFLPFGYFPINTKKAASGLLIPRIGQENARGYNLSDGGYYFAISDYFDLSLRGSVYANGTWMLTTQSNYRKLYKYSGNFSFSYANNVSGHKGLDDYQKNSNYRIGWTFNQDAKASPGSRFAASVNMSSSGFDRTNSYVVAEHVTTQRQSSVSYSKTWEGTPFNFSASMNHSQDVRRKTVNLNLPKANFNMNRIYPLKSRNNPGPAKWWQELQFSYSAQLDNRVSTYDSLLFKSEGWNKVQNGFRHEIPVSLQIRPFKDFSISPSLTYTGVLYSNSIQKFYATDPESGQFLIDKEGKPVLVTDTIRGASYGQAINPTISASYNPQMFIYFDFLNPSSRYQTIRNVIKPSVSFSFTPHFSGFSSKMYRQIQNPISSVYSPYSIYENGIFGTPSTSSRSGNVSFSLVDMLDAKVFDRNDTTGKPKKVKIIDNIGVTTAYNIFADSLKWAPLTLSARTTLVNAVNISMNGNFTFYGVNSSGRPIGTFLIKQTGQLMRLNNFGTSLDFSVSELLKGKKDKNKTATSPNATPNALTGGVQTVNPTNSNDLSQANTGAGVYDQFGYAVFDVPWTMNVSYSLSYTKPGIDKPYITQAMTMNGNVSITKKMSMTYTSGYDFTHNEITMTQIGISRDLHCWEMNFNWVPNGTMKMWNFTIRVKASVLGDLKYERRKDFHDTY